MPYQLEKQPDEINKDEKDFAEFFGPLMPSLDSLKKVGHIGSGITCGIAMFFIIQSHIPNIGKAYLIFISAFLAILISGTIEKGIANVFPLWFRQIIHGKFSNRWYIIMFVFLSLFVLPMVVLSPIISGIGGKESVETGFKDFENTPTDSIDLKYNNKQDSINNFYQNQKVEANKNIANKKQTITNKYKTKINVWNAYYTKHKKLDPEKYRYAKSHMEKAKSKIRDLKALREEEIDTEESKRLDLIAAYNSTLLSATKNLELEKKVEVAKIEKFDSEGKAEWSRKKTVWRSFGLIVGVLCSMIVLFVIIIREIYSKGSGHEYDKKEHIKKPSKLKQILNIWNDRKDKFFERKIKKWNPTSSHSEDPVRPIGFVQNPKPEPEPERPENFETQGVPPMDDRLNVDIKKLVQDCRNNFRRGNNPKKGKAYRNEKIALYNDLKGELEQHNYYVVPSGADTLSIGLKEN